MKIHEFQARQLLADAGVAVPPARVARSGAEAAEAFDELAVPAVMVKAQVHAGGRGKAGGIKRVESRERARLEADRMLRKPLVTGQTGPAGVPVRAVMLTPAVEIAREFYLGVTVDRTRGAPVMMASSQGGVDIEEVVRDNPLALRKETFHPLAGLQPFQARNLVVALGLQGRPATAAAGLVLALARLFVEKDCSLAEINPLALTRDGQVLALDAKINIDDNALFRHPDIAAMAEPADEDPAETRARQAELSYVALDGDIGCLVNGAGLAMATMDIIKLHGGEPANFLDVGGGVSSDSAIEAFRILLGEPKVKAVLVNIFGGIAKCDLIAEALIRAGREVGFNVPVVVRLEGTNVERARELLDEAAAELPALVSASDLADAARKAVAAVRT